MIIMTERSRNIKLDESIWQHLDIEARKRGLRKVEDLLYQWFNEGKL